MATSYRDMNGEKFLGELRSFEPNLQRIRLPYMTDLAGLPEFEETMERLRGNVGYTPDLERLRAPGLIAPRLYLPPQSILSDADLSGTNLRGAHLFMADLRGAYLRGAHLFMADLRGAYLRGAHLSGTNLRGAYLRGADLQWAGLFDADLSETNLRGAHLFMADLREANLRGAHIELAIGLTQKQLDSCISR